MRRPCGNLSTIESALATGVRTSKPPLTASTGTFGNGPAARGVLPAGDGQSLQNVAEPVRAVHEPKGPNEPGDIAAIAALSTPSRSDTGVVGAHGNCPSAHVVATLS